MAPFAGLLWARVYAMSRHNEGMRWVIGALGLLLYMGSLGTQVVRKLPFTFSSAINISSNTIRWQFIVVKNTCNVTGQDLRAIDLWVTAAVIVDHVYISLCQGWELLRFSSSLTDHLFQVDTINGVLLVLFDTLVVVVTLHNTLGYVRRSREFQMLPRKSLTQTVADQGSLIHSYISKWLITSLGLIRYGSVLDDCHHCKLYQG
jgi:hypothetical protein